MASVIAYFSMEIAVESSIPTYAGGLGVLAGDTLRAAADQGLSMVGVTLLSRKGFFRQRLDAQGRQYEEADEWPVVERMDSLPGRAAVSIAGRRVVVRAWRFVIRGGAGDVPVYLLDTDLPENAASDRRLTDQLYGGDERYRIAQEAVLGIGGVRILRELGYTNITRFHMNEGHASLLAVELLAEQETRHGRIGSAAIEAVREQCVFTTHTPVPAGHDQFDMKLAREMLTDAQPLWRQQARLSHEGALNMTYLALHMSRYVNGVAKRHGEVSGRMFVGYEIDSITNGVHAATWTAPAIQHLLDRHIPDWRSDNYSLRHALSVARDQIRAAHQDAKRALIEHVREACAVALDEEVLTLGFARRATLYKRPDLLFRDVDRLKRIAAQGKGLQIVYAGKAHPRDNKGKELIQRVCVLARELRGTVKIVYLPDYDVGVAGLMSSGTDLWLNTPQPPLEASGTSGMKAALNGVPSLSILDGWWVEGCIEGVTGWAIGNGEHGTDNDLDHDAASLYDKLEQTIVPMYYDDPDQYQRVMQNAVAINGSFFNAQRMLSQYVAKAYFG